MHTRTPVSPFPLTSCYNCSYFWPFIQQLLSHFLSIPWWIDKDVLFIHLVLTQILHTMSNFCSLLSCISPSKGKLSSLCNGQLSKPHFGPLRTRKTGKTMSILSTLCSFCLSNFLTYALRWWSAKADSLWFPLWIYCGNLQSHVLGHLKTSYSSVSGKIWTLFLNRSSSNGTCSCQYCPTRCSSPIISWWKSSKSVCLRL